jgi:hypothetical protein
MLPPGENAGNAEHATARGKVVTHEGFTGMAFARPPPSAAPVGWRLSYDDHTGA